MLSKAKILIIDTCVLIGLCIGVVIVYKQSVISSMQVFIGIMGCILICAVLFAGAAILKYSVNKLKTISVLKLIQSVWNSHLFLVFKIIFILRKNYSNRIIETTFTYFVHYYRKNCEEITHSRSFPKDEFPDGTYNVVKVYLYITRIRAENNKLLASIDFSNDRPTLYGTPFDKLQSKINANYELTITGLDSSDVMTYTQQRAFETKCKSALLTQDTEIATWLIRNRSHFGF